MSCPGKSTFEVSLEKVANGVHRRLSRTMTYNPQAKALLVDLPPQRVHPDISDALPQIPPPYPRHMYLGEMSKDIDSCCSCS